MENNNIPGLSDIENEVKEIYAKLNIDGSDTVKLDQKDIDRLLDIIDELDKKLTDLDNNQE